jgi:hypothetical protein
MTPRPLTKALAASGGVPLREEGVFLRVTYDDLDVLCPGC